LGSAWLSDLVILNNPSLIKAVKDSQLHILIVPHKLDEAFIRELKNQCENLFGVDNIVEVINDLSSSYKDGKIVILQKSGILCELYSQFSLTYVGGGYERSIHSVLEPFFSNNVVITGPKIKRSTEIELASKIAPDEIHVLKNPESFYTIVESVQLLNLKIMERRAFSLQVEQNMKLIIDELLML
jgi:3-deoxy-D-manno-octulosonic-acid transferase